MKPLKPFRQTPGLCGPASLKILLSHYGADFSEKELTQLCDATAESGTDHADLMAALGVFGFRVTSKVNAKIEDIRSYLLRDIPVVVGWWSTDEDHFSVVYDLDDRSIFMMDPELDEGIRKMPIKDFEKVWYDFDTPKNKRVNRWMLAIEN